jgi:hypothetical protein
VYCKTCDHYVAQMETQPCEQCGATMCPGCALPTNDPDLSVCSHLCHAKFSKRLKNEAA